MPKKGTGKLTGVPIATKAEKNKFERFAGHVSNPKAEKFADAKNPGKFYNGKASWEK